MAAFHERKLDDNGAIADEADAAELIASMTTELAQLARRHGLDTLGYLLDMARLEADTVTRGFDSARAVG